MTDPEDKSAVQSTPETVSDVMEKTWATLNPPDEAEKPAIEAENPVEAALEAEKPVEAEKPAPDPDAMPQDMPSTIKAHWGKMDADTRTAFVAAQRDLGKKLAEQGRVTRAVQPVVDVLRQAIGEIPSMRDMKPEEIARDVFQMAKIQGELARDPVKTLLGIAQQYGAMDGMKAALAGAAAVAPDATAKEIRDLRAQVARLSDPNYVDSRVTQSLRAQTVERDVMGFVSSKPEWAQVEHLIAAILPAVIQNAPAGTSHAELLERAYDMALHANPDTRVKFAAAPAPVTDPGRTAVQAQAKAINVRSNGSTPPAPQTLREGFERAWANSNR